MEGDPLDEITNLEQQYYTEGYNLGVEDGSRAGRIEGRIFGLEKGYKKFVEMGRLNGRAIVWDARLKLAQTSSEDRSSRGGERVKGVNERLQKHVSRLRMLTDPETLVMENSEDAVSEFDDRMKDAKAKSTLISKILGESDMVEIDEDVTKSQSIESTGGKRTRVKKGEASKRTGEMEDFTGIPRGAR